MLFSSTRISGSGSGGGGGGTVTSIAGINSVKTTPSPITGTGQIMLENDALAPGANMVYGTDALGAKGWQSSGAGGTIGGSIGASQIAFGAPIPNTIAGSNDFTFDATEHLNLTVGGNGLFDVTPVSNTAYLGAATGGGIGNAMVLDWGVTPAGNYIKWIGNSGDRLKYEGSAGVYSFGDLSDTANRNKLVMNDFVGSHTHSVSGQFLITNTAASADQVFNATISPSLQVSFGNLTGAGNQTIAQLSDSAKSFTIQAGTGHILSLNRTTGIYGIGDFDAVVNGTRMTVDDNFDIIHNFTDGTFDVVDSTNTKKFLLVTATAGVALGDVSSSFAGGNVIINGSTNTVTNSLLVWDMGATNIQNILDPVLPQDAATKAYVDGFLIGLQWKAIVDVATTTALPVSTYANGAGGVGATITSTDGAFPPLGNIDGYAVTVGQRVLVKDQASSLENGIYDFTQDGDGVSLPWILTRSTDCDSSAEATNAACAVANGSVNMNTGWTQTFPTPTIGTDPLNWVVFLNTVYTASSGITLTGHNFTLDVTNPNTWSGLQTFGSSDFRLAGGTSGFLSMDATAVTTSYGLVWPAAQGASGQTIVNDGAGNLSWGAAGPLLQTDGVTNSTQALLNLASGTGITLSEVAGTVTIDATGVSGVSSVTNSDGTLTISPTTGAVVASVATGGVGYDQLADEGELAIISAFLFLSGN